MRVTITGRFMSVCEPNHGRTYDHRGNLIATSQIRGTGRRIAKKQHARKVRHLSLNDRD